MTSISYPTGRSPARLARPAAFAVVTGCYLVAGAAALVTALILRHHHPITVAFVADLVATVAVFALSMLLANSSLYDPYWSVAPPVIAIAWVAVSPDHLGGGVTARQVIVKLLVAIWAIR